MEDVHDIFNKALDEMTEASQDFMTKLSKILIKHEIPSEIGVPMSIDVIKLMYDSGVQTAEKQGYDTSVIDYFDKVKKDVQSK